VPLLRPLHAAVALTVLGSAVLATGCGGGKKESKETTSTTTAPTVNRIRILAGTMSGAGIPEVPKGAGGTATVTLNLGTGRACWTLSVRGVDKPVSAHVHQGASGAAGPVVIPLGDTFSRKGCVLSNQRALRAVAAAPGSYYVDVHTTKHIQGAMRGQLHLTHG
jgi:hypothetical protein